MLRRIVRRMGLANGKDYNEGSRMIGCVDVRGLVGHEPPALKPMAQPIKEIWGSRWGPVWFSAAP